MQKTHPRTFVEASGVSLCTVFPDQQVSQFFCIGLSDMKNLKEKKTFQDLKSCSRSS